MRSALVPLVALTIAAWPADASGGTFVVSPTGSDAGTGSSASPFRTISRAAGVARRGDVVKVRGGRYREQVALSGANRDVAFRGSPGAVIDGERTREFGFDNQGAAGVGITGFEIMGQTGAGINAKHGEQSLIARNVIHHIGTPGDPTANGIRIAWGHGSRISENTIHHVGPGWKAIGVWLLETRNAAVRRNVIFLVRKEAIRDWKGLENQIAGNRVFLNWVGIALNTSTGSTVVGNYAADNVEGIAIKHQSFASVLSYWNLATGRWSRVTGNSVHRSSEASIWLGQSDEPMDYVEVSGNTFAGAGTAFVRDRPELRGPNVAVNGNSYSVDGGQPTWLYKAGWGSNPGLNSWDQVRATVGWEREGGLPAAVAEPRTVAPTELKWTPFAMTPIDSSSKGTWYTRTHLDETSDNNQNSYWVTSTGGGEYVTFDLGQIRTFNHLVLAVYSHMDKRNVRTYQFDASTDGRTWVTIKQGVNPDSAGSAYPYELDRPRSARYVRFTAVDNFCDSYTPRQGCGQEFVISDLQVGMLGCRGTSPPAAIRLGGRARLTRNRRLRLAIDCLAGTRGTRASVTVSQLLRSGKRRPLVRRRVGVRAGGGVVAVPVSRQAARRIRKGGRSRFLITIRTPDGGAYSQPLRIARRRGKG